MRGKLGAALRAGVQVFVAGFVLAAGCVNCSGLGQNRNGWIAFVVAAILAAGVGWVAALGDYRRSLRRARFRAGRCLQCGYDLRATPGRCPECGKAHPFRRRPR